MKKIIKISLFLFIFCIAIYSGLYLYAKVTPKLSIKSANSFYFYDNENNLYTGTNDDWASLENISKDLINATISIEDKNF